jgi:ribosome maturation factor RimP
MKALQSEIINIIKDTVEENGYELVETQCFLKGKNPLIRVFIDRPGGIKVQECSSLTRTLLDIFDREELVTLLNYRLEVSSPGADRPLKTKRDFARNISRNIIVKYKTEEGIKELSGVVVSAEPDLALEQPDGIILKIPFDSIVSGKVVFKW